MEHVEWYERVDKDLKRTRSSSESENTSAVVLVVTARRCAVQFWQCKDRW